MLILFFIICSFSSRGYVLGSSTQAKNEVGMDLIEPSESKLSIIGKAEIKCDPKPGESPSKIKKFAIDMNFTSSDTSHSWKSKRDNFKKIQNLIDSSIFNAKEQHSNDQKFTGSKWNFPILGNANSNMKLSNDDDKFLKRIVAIRQHMEELNNKNAPHEKNNSPFIRRLKQQNVKEMEDNALQVSKIPHPLLDNKIKRKNKISSTQLNHRENYLSNNIKLLKPIDLESDQEEPILTKHAKSDSCNCKENTYILLLGITFLAINFIMLTSWCCMTNHPITNKLRSVFESRKGGGCHKHSNC